MGFRGVYDHPPKSPDTGNYNGFYWVIVPLLCVGISYSSRLNEINSLPKSKTI
jgi:hypothetical protein